MQDSYRINNKYTPISFFLFNTKLIFFKANKYIFLFLIEHYIIKNDIIMYYLQPNSRVLKHLSKKKKKKKAMEKRKNLLLPPLFSISPACYLEGTDITKITQSCFSIPDSTRSYIFGCLVVILLFISVRFHKCSIGFKSDNMLGQLRCF